MWCTLHCIPPVYVAFNILYDNLRYRADYSNSHGATSSGVLRYTIYTYTAHRWWIIWFYWSYCNFLWVMLKLMWQHIRVVSGMYSVPIWRIKIIYVALQFSSTVYDDFLCRQCTEFVNYFFLELQCNFRGIPQPHVAEHSWCSTPLIHTIFIDSWPTGTSMFQVPIWNRPTFHST
jgi:hypothetical protein